MAGAAAIVPIKLIKAVFMKCREKMGRIMAPEFSDSAVKSDERRMWQFFECKRIILGLISGIGRRCG